MREAIQKLNKSTLAQDTGISHSRLRKYSAGIIENLKEDEIETIHNYLLMLAEKFNQK